MKKEKEVVGVCPLCGRDLIVGPSINDHHFLPKSRGGKAEDKVTLHRVCHDMLHRIFTEKQLEREYNTPEKCLQHEDIIKYVKWLSKKDPEFMDSVKTSNKKRRGR